MKILASLLANKVTLQPSIVIDGVADTVSAQQFPASTSLVLVLIIQAAPTEYGEGHCVEIRVVNNEGAASSEFKQEMPFKIPDSGIGGDFPTVYFTAEMSNMVFPKIGTYVVEVCIDGAIVRRLPLYVKSAL